MNRVTAYNKESVADMMDSTKCCVVVPTYNNASTLYSVVTGVHEYCRSVIVVDDGSTDNTQSVLKSLPFDIFLVSYKDNRGKGHALKMGFNKALELGFENVITIDSDGQHYPHNIPLFIEALEKNMGALIVGSRNLDIDNVPGKNKFANKFSNFWFYIQTGYRLCDTQTGYRLYPISRMKFYRHITDRYESELELLVLAAWNSIKLVPIKVDVYYPPQGERVSHFRPFADFMRITLLNTCLCFGALLYGWPVKGLRYLKDILTKRNTLN